MPELQTLDAATATSIVAEGLDRPESVTTGPDGTLYAGGWNGEIYRIDPGSGEVGVLARIGGIVLGLCADADSNIYACNVIDRLVVKVTPEGEVSTWSTAADGVPYTTPNYCAFDASGTLWLSDSGVEDPLHPTGRIVRIPPSGGDGTTASSARPLNFPNGLCLDADGGVLFLESFGHGISRLRDGEIEDLVELPGHTPDGIAVDAAGGMVVASFYPHRLLYVAPGATTAQPLLDDPVGITLRAPANVTFFGAGLTQIAISALAGSKILAVAAPQPGLPLHYPAISGRS